MPSTYNHAPPPSYVNALQYALPGSDVINGSSASSPAMNITYAFETSQPSDLWYGFSGWKAFTAAQEATIASVLAEFASMLNLTFTEVGVANPDPDINLGRIATSTGEGGQGGMAYTYTTGAPAGELDGFALFSSKFASIPRGVILHELSHALTMKHPGNYTGGAGSTPGPYLPNGFDNNKYSVMAYDTNPDTHARSIHLMLLDIAALQARFGANLSYRTGDNVYKGQASLKAIWDAGGADKIDGSNHITALRIDLRDGYFSSVGQHHNLAIAYGVIIENAVGGSGKDTVIGNQWANVLSGRAGSDTLKGLGGSDALWSGGGNDVLRGGAGADIFVFNAAYSNAYNVDRILDFNFYVDTIWLDDAVFKALPAGALDPDAFHIGGAAGDAEDRIVYTSGNGNLFYDVNGNAPGGAVKIATLSPSLALSNGDFLVF